MLRIVDTHLHLLNVAGFDYPWIDGAGHDFLREGYLVEDWRADVGDLEVIAAVHVEAQIDHSLDQVEETAWLAELDESPAPLVFLVHADLRGTNFDEALARHCEYPATRGIREIGWYDPRSTRADMPRQNPMLDPAWRAGLGHLAARGLSCDLFVWWHQLEHAAELFAAVPDVTLVIEHTGLPPIDDAEQMQVWRRGLRRIGEQVPNALLKLSGLALFSPDWRVDAVRRTLRDAIELFGPERCMFGSNFPLDRSVATYEEIWSIFDGVSRDLSAAERTALFSANALRAYRIGLGAGL
jgi:predicted TIM-barrel fold metal-dependent hydrolase